MTECPPNVMFLDKEAFDEGHAIIEAFQTMETAGTFDVKVAAPYIFRDILTLFIIGLQTCETRGDILEHAVDVLIKVGVLDDTAESREVWDSFEELCDYLRLEHGKENGQ